MLVRRIKYRSAANIYGAMPEGLLIEGFPRIVSLPLEGKAYKVSQSPVIPLISGEWIVSHVWHEILRLSPHLFWLGLFTHRAFSSAQDDDTRGRMVSQAGGIADFLEDGILVS